MASGKLELFIIAFIAGLIMTPIVDWAYDQIGPKIGLPTL